MSILRKILLVLVVLTTAILLYATTKPDSFRIERSLVVQAPAEKIFPLINDLHQWQAWSPWEGLDPDLKRHYSGNASGHGAVYAWDGNSKVGAGSMTITASQPPAHIVIDLRFLRPFEARNEAEFILAPEAGGTRVTWRMTGPNPYIAKVMQVFFSPDALVGKDFETGLDKLKHLSES